MSTLDRIDRINDFWVREYARYIFQHQHPLNRATHMVGIPVIAISMIWALLSLSWKIFLVGQIVGWAFQLLGHRIEGNRPAFVTNRSFVPTLMGPLMVAVEFLDLFGLRPRFARKARKFLLAG